VSTAAVLLAAGAGRRWEGKSHKLLAPFRGRPLVVWAFEHALAAGLDETVVITGAADLKDVLPAGARLVRNPDWEQGQAGSVQVSIAYARAAGHGAVVVGLGDQPLVVPSAWRAVADGGSPIAVATYAGRRGNPVRLSSAVWDLLPVAGDVGARALMADRPDLVGEVACDGDPADVDTVEDLERWS
jgi:CTP:molybdopterin cytidylyltransferase MocA